MIDDDLGLRLELVERNLLEYERSDEGVERMAEMQNYLAALNTLIAHSHRLALDEMDDEMEWLVEQKQRELMELLNEIEVE